MQVIASLISGEREAPAGPAAPESDIKISIISEIYFAALKSV
jgi:hypothetical protein